MKLKIIVLLMLGLNFTAFSQNRSWQIGLEQDILPYLTQGYFIGGWAGKGRVRARVLTAHVHKPEWITPEGFTNNQVTAYALLGDYFLKEDWDGWWLGAGMVYWDSSIQLPSGSNTTFYENWMLNGSVGYQWKFYRNFYLCPWAGLHLRIEGDKEVSIDGSSFTTPLFTPEASLKIGWYF